MVQPTYGSYLLAVRLKFDAILEMKEFSNPFMYLLIQLLFLLPPTPVLVVELLDAAAEGPNLPLFSSSFSSSFRSSSCGKIVEYCRVKKQNTGRNLIKSKVWRAVIKYQVSNS